MRKTTAMARALRPKDSVEGSPHPISLADVPAAVSAIGAIALSMSVALQIGYFLAIDFRLLSLFSVQDAIVGGLKLVPFALLLFLATAVWVELKDSDSTGHRKSTMWPFRLFGLIGFFNIIGSEDRFLGLLFLTASLSLEAMERVDRKNFPRRKGLALLLTIVGIAAPVATGAAGGFIAQEELKRKTFDYRIVTKDQAFDALLLQGGSDYLLVRSTPDTVTLVPKSELKEIRVLKVNAPKPWFQIRAWIRSLFDW